MRRRRGEPFAGEAGLIALRGFGLQARIADVITRLREIVE